MIRSLHIGKLLLFLALLAGSLGLVVLATARGYGITNEEPKPKRVYNPSVRRHGVIYYVPGRRYRGFYDGGPGVGK